MESLIWGSGTFVLVDGHHYVLTAAHVWRELHRAKRFALKFEDGPEFLELSKEHLRVRSLPELEFMPRERADWPRDGPDVALIALPDDCVSEIGGARRFYDLDQQPARVPDPAGRGVWAVLGIPRELSPMKPAEGTTFIGLYHSFVVHTAQQGDLDYVDLRYDREAFPDQPEDYGGASGGGLWHAEPVDAATWRLTLEGLVYWQERDRTTQTRGFLRCHGRRTMDLLTNASAPVEGAAALKTLRLRAGFS